MIKVSVVISTRNAARDLNVCLESLKKQTRQPDEVIVVDRDSSDKTKEVAREFTKEVYNYGPERSAQRNFGAEKAKGDFLLFIDADMELSSGVITNLVKLIEDEPEISVVTIPEESVGEGFWSTVKSFERSFYIGDKSMEAPRFIKRQVFLAVGGYDTEMIAGEDWDLRRRLVEFKVKFGRINDLIYHHEGRLTLLKTASKKYYYGTKIGIYFKKNKVNYSQVSPVRSSFIKNYSKLFSKPQMTLGLLVLKFTEMGAAGTGYLVDLISRQIKRI